MRDLISIIIPIYNAEKYIERCMDCILNQSYKNIEIILVDDGSIDDSQIICKKYLSISEKVAYYYKKNGGPASARNLGLKKANGRFVFFMDADDLIERNAIEKLYEDAIRFNVDIVIGNARRIDMMGKESDTCSRKSCLIKDKSNITNLICKYANDIKDYKILWTVWGKLYRLDIIKENKIYFNEHMISWEDMPYVITYLSFCNRIYYDEQCLYKYIHFGQDNTGSHNIIKQPCAYKNFIKAFSVVLSGKEYETILKNCYSECAILAMFNCARIIEITSKKDVQKLYRIIRKIVHDNILQNSIDYYVQKHKDNSRLIPYFIKKKWIWMILLTLKIQIHRLQKSTN